MTDDNLDEYIECFIYRIIESEKNVIMYNIEKYIDILIGDVLKNNGEIYILTKIIGNGNTNIFIYNPNKNEGYKTRKFIFSTQEYTDFKIKIDTHELKEIIDNANYEGTFIDTHSDNELTFNNNNNNLQFNNNNCNIFIKLGTYFYFCIINIDDEDNKNVKYERYIKEEEKYVVNKRTNVDELYDVIVNIVEEKSDTEEKSDDIEVNSNIYSSMWYRKLPQRKEDLINEINESKQASKFMTKIVNEATKIANQAKSKISNIDGTNTDKQEILLQISIINGLKNLNSNNIGSNDINKAIEAIESIKTIITKTTDEFDISKLKINIKNLSELLSNLQHSLVITGGKKPTSNKRFTIKSKRSNK
jgi:hypothetical protein